MTTHLHVHLEPNERKRRHLGEFRIDYANAAQFFSEHAQDNPRRVVVNLDDLEVFIKEFHAERYAQNIDDAELRISPRRSLSPTVSLSDVLSSADRVVSNMRAPMQGLFMRSVWFVENFPVNGAPT
jgi:adenosine deaminase